MITIFSFSVPPRLCSYLKVSVRLWIPMVEWTQTGGSLQPTHLTVPSTIDHWKVNNVVKLSPQPCHDKLKLAAWTKNYCLQLSHKWEMQQKVATCPILVCFEVAMFIHISTIQWWLSGELTWLEQANLLWCPLLTMCTTLSNQKWRNV